MADYISALNGEQMDEALMDVALRNSEAWAVGTRNGVNVTSADETYHNNAKYYAQVAKSAIPGTYTAAVRWDIAQGLAGESQEQARANISAGASNRNLLDNPFFRVNQRSATRGTSANQYIADRWQTSYGSGGVTWSRTDDTVTVQSTSGASAAYLYQNIEPSLFSFLAGKDVTISVMKNDYSVVSGSLTVSATTLMSKALGQDTDGGNINCSLNPTLSRINIYKQNTALTIRAVKLELGSYSTLANDVPPNYGEELRKCRYYYRVINCTSRGRLFLGIGYGSTGVEIPNVFGIGNEMRISTPNVAATGTFYVNAGSDIAVTSVTKNTNNSELSLSFNVASGVTAHQMYSIIGTAGAKIEFNADL